MQRMLQFFQKYVIAVIGVGLLVIVLVLLAIQTGVQQASIQDHEDRIAQLERDRAEAQQTLDDAQEALYEQITGSDAPRMAQDTQGLAAMMETMVTWDSHESYEEARNTVFEQYDITDGSFTELFPEAPVTTDGAGNEYYYIDAAGLNGHLGEYSIELLEVSGTDYSYVMFADMVTEQTIGDATGSNAVPIILFATVASDGQLYDVRGYAGSEVTRSSQK